VTVRKQIPGLITFEELRPVNGSAHKPLGGAKRFSHRESHDVSRFSYVCSDMAVTPKAGQNGATSLRPAILSCSASPDAVDVLPSATGCPPPIQMWAAPGCRSRLFFSPETTPLRGDEEVVFVKSTGH
jgi:hypothetical protein